MTPHEALTHAIRDHIDAGLPRPACTRDPDRWMSDNHDALLSAAVHCLSCPLRDPCRDAGEDETTGVWGGVIRTKTRKRRTAA